MTNKKRGGKEGSSFLNRKISNRLSYTIIAAFALILAGVFVYAQTAHNPGHPITQIDQPTGCSSGQYLQWTGSAWSCANVNVSGGGTGNISGGGIVNYLTKWTGTNTIGSLDVKETIYGGSLDYKGIILGAGSYYGNLSLLTSDIDDNFPKIYSPRYLVLHSNDIQIETGTFLNATTKLSINASDVMIGNTKVGVNLNVYGKTKFNGNGIGAFSVSNPNVPGFDALVINHGPSISSTYIKGNLNVTNGDLYVTNGDFGINQGSYNGFIKVAKIDGNIPTLDTGDEACGVRYKCVAISRLSGSCNVRTDCSLCSSVHNYGIINVAVCAYVN